MPIGFFRSAFVRLGPTERLRRCFGSCVKKKADSFEPAFVLLVFLPRVETLGYNTRHSPVAGLQNDRGFAFTK